MASVTDGAFRNVRGRGFRDDAVSAASLSYDATVLDLRVSEVLITDPDAQLLIEEVQEEYVVRYGSRDESPIDHAEFVAPRGASSSATSTACLSVCGAWRRRTDVEFAGTTNTAKVKRMYVAPARWPRAGAPDAGPPRGDRRRGRGVGPGPGDGLKQPEAIALYGRPATPRWRASATTGTPASVSASGSSSGVSSRTRRW